MTSRLTAVRTKPCVIFSPRRCQWSRKAAPLVKGTRPRPTPAQALRGPRRRRTAAMMSPSPLCQPCWPAGPSQTSLTPAPPSDGCLWKVTLHQTSLRVPKFLRGLPNHSLGESTLNEKRGAASKVLLPHHSSPVRSRAS